MPGVLVGRCIGGWPIFFLVNKLQWQSTLVLQTTLAGEQALNQVAEQRRGRDGLLRRQPPLWRLGG